VIGVPLHHYTAMDAKAMLERLSANVREVVGVQDQHITWNKPFQHCSSFHHYGE
jgi:hypothetical protein